MDDDAVLYRFLASLIGTAVGALISVAVAFFTLRRDRKRQEAEFLDRRASQERLFAQDRAKQEREFAEELATSEATAKQERDTLRNAVQAEFQRVEAVVARQRKYIWDDDKNAVRAGFERSPLNWAPIHTPIWESIVTHGKVGLLPSVDAEQWSWFFGYVRWMNSDLFPLYKFYRDEKRLEEFGQHVASAYLTLLAGEWRPQKIAPPTFVSSARDAQPKKEGG